MNQLLLGTRIFLASSCILAVSGASTEAKKPDRTDDTQAPAYQIDAFEPFGGSSVLSSVIDINESGTAAVGGAELPGGQWRSAFLDIAEGSYITFADGVDIRAVNNLNQLVGGTNGMGAYWKDPQAAAMALPPLSGHAVTFATAINDAGIVLGVSRSTDQADRGTAVVWQVTNDNQGGLSIGGPFELPDNERGTENEGLSELVGTTARATGRTLSGAAVWNIGLDGDGRLIPPSMPQILGAFDDPFGARGLGVNSEGNVVGRSDDRPFIAFVGEALQQLPVPRKTQTASARDVNDTGQIVGNLFFEPRPNQPIQDRQYDALTWIDNSPVLLETLLDSNSSWSRLTGAYDIANNGIIAGGGIVDGIHRGLLMTPPVSTVTATAVPEPGSVFLLAFVGISLMLFRSRSGSSALTFSLILGTAAMLPKTELQGAQFLPLGVETFAEGVSGDGTATVGTGPSSQSDALLWMSNSTVNLGDLPGACCSVALAASNSGSVVVGGSDSQAFRWTDSEGMQGLGFLPGMANSIARDISANGSIIVGTSYADGVPTEAPAEAYLWDEGSGMVGLGSLPGRNRSAAGGISADGSVVVGASGVVTSDQEAFRWTEDAGMVGLGALPGDDRSIAFDVSADGLVVVGYSFSDAPGTEAFRWTENDGMLGLGTLPGDTISVAFGVSGDGSFAVGYSEGDSSGQEAFLWDATHGMRRMTDVLSATGLDMTGWTLLQARGISDDGNVIVGWGQNPMGQDEAWIARLDAVPEPSTAALVVVGLVGLAVRARRTRAGR